MTRQSQVAEPGARKRRRRRERERRRAQPERPSPTGEEEWKGPDRLAEKEKKADVTTWWAEWPRSRQRHGTVILTDCNN